MEGTCLLIDIVKSFIHSEVFENVEERGLSVRGWWANPFWEENVLKNEEICAGREKEHTSIPGQKEQAGKRREGTKDGTAFDWRVSCEISICRMQVSR